LHLSEFNKIIIKYEVHDMSSAAAIISRTGKTFNKQITGTTARASLYWKTLFVELARASRHLVRRVNQNRVACARRRWTARAEIRYRCGDGMCEDDTILLYTIPLVPVHRRVRKAVTIFKNSYYYYYYFFIRAIRRVRNALPSRGPNKFPVL